ncbi:MAG: phage tail sheath subtilisin-like domain-containing protein [Planctomycetota bacterium]
MVSFNEIPAGIRTPFVAVEFDASQAQGQFGTQPYRALLVGQKLAAGNVAELTPTQITRAEEAGAAFGQGSMLHAMARAFFAQTQDIEAVFIALDDPSGGSQATGTVTFAVSSPQPGAVRVYVGGRRYSVPTTAQSTADSLASALAAQVSADPDAYVTAAAVAGVVTLTARHAGAAAGEIDVRHSYFDDERLPLGVTCTVVAMSGGAGDVDLDEVIAALPEEQYNLLAVPYTDASNLTKLETELAARFGPMRPIDGVAVCPSAAAYGALTTLGNSRNSPHVVISAATGSPSPVWEWSGALAALIAQQGEIDPARPMQTLPLASILPPEPGARLTRDERDLLLGDGIATTTTNAAGQVAVERLITTYQTSPQGAPDTAYLDVTTLLTIGRLRFDVRALFGTKFPRHKLANDGTVFGAGQSVITPSIARAELIGLARQWESAGLVENVDGFKADIIVERDAQDPSRLNAYVPPDLINGLRVFAAQVGFRL